VRPPHGILNRRQVHRSATRHSRSTSRYGTTNANACWGMEPMELGREPGVSPEGTRGQPGFAVIFGNRRGRVGPGGRPPRPPTGPDVPFEEASGSSHCGIAVPHATGAFRRHTLVRFGVLGVGPTPRPQRGAPFAPRGPVGPVPPLRRYYGVLRLLAVHLAALRFLRMAIAIVSSPFRPHRLGTGAVDQPGVGKPGLQPAVSMETAGSPRFPSNPYDHSPCSPTPARPGTLVGPSVANAWHGPRI
jgi:hypothetical protein